MKYKVIYTILIISLIIISTISPIIVKAYTKPLYPLMFLGASRTTSDGKSPYPNTIATLTLYFTPRNDEGIEDLLVRLQLPKPLSSEDGGSSIYLAHPEFVAKGEIIELKTNIIIPADAEPGIYSFVAYVQYKIPISKYVKEQKGTTFSFQLSLYEKPSLTINAKLLKLNPDSINTLEFELFFNGTVESSVSVSVSSNDISILNYTPTTIHVSPGESFKVKVKAYVPPYDKLMKPLVSVNVKASVKQLDHITETASTFYYLVLDNREPLIKLDTIRTRYMNGVVTIDGIVKNFGNKSVSNLTVEITSESPNVIVENDLVNIGVLNPGERKSFEVTLKTLSSENISIEFSIMFFSDKPYELRKHYRISLPTDISDLVKVSYEINNGEPLKLGEINTLTLTVISNTQLEITNVVAELILPEIFGSKIVQSYSRTLDFGEEAKFSFNFYLPDTLPITSYEVPLTIRLAITVEKGLFTLKKTLNVVGEVVEKPEFLINLGTYGIKQAMEQDIVFYIQNKGLVPTKVTISASSNQLSILSLNPQYILLDPGEKAKIVAKVYCPMLSENVETATMNLELKYKWKGVEEYISKTFQIPVVREAKLRIVELQQTQSEDRVIIKGQLVNIGDAKAKYVTLASKVVKGNVSIDNPTVYLGDLDSGEGTRFSIYTRTLGVMEAKILLTIDYQQPNRTWSSISKEITIHFKQEIKETSKVGMEFSEIALPILGVVASIIAVAVILIKYVKRK